LSVPRASPAAGLARVPARGGAPAGGFRAAGGFNNEAGTAPALAPLRRGWDPPQARKADSPSVRV